MPNGNRRHHRPDGAAPHLKRNGHRTVHQVQDAASHGGTSTESFIRAAGNWANVGSEHVESEVKNFALLAQEGPPPEGYQVSGWLLSFAHEIEKSASPKRMVEKHLTPEGATHREAHHSGHQALGAEATVTF